MLPECSVKFESCLVPAPPPGALNAPPDMFSLFQFSLFRQFLQILHNFLHRFRYFSCQIYNLIYVKNENLPECDKPPRFTPIQLFKKACSLAPFLSGVVTGWDCLRDAMSWEGALGLTHMEWEGDSPATFLKATFLGTCRFFVCWQEVALARARPENSEKMK